MRAVVNFTFFCLYKAAEICNMKSIVFFLIAAGLALCFSKCQLAEKNATGNIESFDQGNHAVALSPLDTSLQSYFPLSSQVSTKAFYAGRKFERFWFSGSQTTPATDTLLQLVSVVAFPVNGV